MVAFFVAHPADCHSERSEESLAYEILIRNFNTITRWIHSLNARANQEQILHCVQNDSYVLH